MTILMLAGMLALRVLNYSIGAGVLFHAKILKIRRGILLLFLLPILYAMLPLRISDTLYVGIGGIIVLFALLEGKVNQKIGTVLKSVFIIICLEEAIQVILDLALLHLFNLQREHYRNFWLLGIIETGSWLVIGILKKRKYVITRRYINIFINSAMGIMMFSLAFAVVGISYAAPYVPNKKFLTLSNGLVVISLLGIVFLGLFLFYVQDANKKYKRLLETEQLLRNAQKNNYEAMLAKEEETRKFRHDIDNHIMCLEELVKVGNITQIRDYIGQMKTKKFEINKKHYDTGNEIMDAIINHFISMLDENVDIKLFGGCSGEVKVNNVELCSILSNPLQNVVEALNKQKEGKKYIKIWIKSTEQNIKIEIVNSFITDEIKMQKGLPKTTKLDGKNHGIGLKNVKELVEKNQGRFDIEILESAFKIVLVLPKRE